MPTEDQRFFTDAVLVAIAEHGLVPSVQAARMTLAAAPEAWQGAMAAGLLGVGSVVAGSSEVAGKFLVELIAEREEERRLVRGRRQGRPEAPRRGEAEGAGPRPSAALGRRSARDPAPEARRRARRGRRSCRDAAAAREAREGDHRSHASDQRQRRDSRRDARRRLSGRRDQGPAAPRPHRRACRASLRGDAAADRLRHVEPRRRGDHLRRPEAAAE